MEFGEKANCYASLHSNDAAELFRSSSRREFCKTLRLQHAAGDVFVGWVGENSLTPGKLVLSKPFAECLALEEGEQVDAFPHAPPIASTVMVQPTLGRVRESAGQLTLSRQTSWCTCASGTASMTGRPRRAAVARRDGQNVHALREFAAACRLLNYKQASSRRTCFRRQLS